MGDQAGATLQNYNSDLVAVRCSGCMSALATLVGRAICRRAGVYPRTPHPCRICAWQCIEELRGKREELNTSIATDEEEKGVACRSGREPRVTLAL